MHANRNKSVMVDRNKAAVNYLIHQVKRYSLRQVRLARSTPREHGRTWNAGTSDIRIAVSLHLFDFVSMRPVGALVLVQALVGAAVRIKKFERIMLSGTCARKLGFGSRIPCYMVITPHSHMQRQQLPRLSATALKDPVNPRLHLRSARMACLPL